MKTKFFAPNSTALTSALSSSHLKRFCRGKKEWQWNPGLTGLLVFLILLQIPFFALAEPKNFDPLRIELRSRSFVPEPGISPEAIAHLQKHLNQGKAAHTMVQLIKVPSQEERQVLQDRGIKLLSYVGGNAWFAAISDHRALSIANKQAANDPALGLVRWMGTIPPEDKMAPHVRLKVFSPAARHTDGKVLLLVSFHKETNLQEAKEKLLAASATPMGSLPDGETLIVAVDEQKIDVLADDDDVRWMEPVPEPGKPESYHIRTHLQADAAQSTGLSGSGIKVGVFEGEHAYLPHPDLTGRLVQGDTNTLHYTDGHATMIAGVIGGNGAASSPVGYYKGMAPQVNMSTYTWGTDSAASVANYFYQLQLAANTQLIDIANNSWGNGSCHNYPYGDYTTRCRSLDQVVHGDTGRPMLVVFSAGNERKGWWDSTNNVYVTDCLTEGTAPYRNYRTINDPKAAKNILVVGAIDSANNRMSDYSSWGPVTDGRLKPELVASGHHDGTLNQNISVLTGQGSMFLTPFHVAGYSGNYGYMGMSSAAAASASGCAALLLECYHTTFNTTANPVPSTLKALLIHSAKDLSDTTEWYHPGPDYASGYGLLQINDAVTLLKKQTFTEGDITDATQVPTYRLTVPFGQSQLKFTLAWDDPAGLENANPVLVNDLDLVVLDPSGKRYYPWTLDPAHPSAAAVRTVVDHLNNVEQVLVDPTVAGGSLTGGVWTVQIQNTRLPQLPQRYSLVAPFAMGLAPYFTSKPQNRTAVPDGTVSFTATAAGTAPMSYQWYFNQSPVAGGTGATLSLVGVQSEQAGTYQVKAWNSYGEAWTAATLTVCEITLAGTFNTAGSANDVSLIGSTAYVADGLEGLQILNVSNPQSISRTGGYQTRTYALGIQTVSWRGFNPPKFAFLGNSNSLDILDVTSSLRPSVINHFDLPGEIYGFSGYQTYYCFAAGSAGVLVTKTNSTRSLVASFNTKGTACAIAVANSLFYVADGLNGLRILRFTASLSGTNLTSVGGYDPCPLVIDPRCNAFASDVQVIGTTAYVTFGTAGIKILDVSDPSRIVVLGAYNTPGTATGISVSGKLAYVADGSAGVEVLDVSNPASIKLLCQYNTPGTARKLQVSGNRIYVADGAAGLQVLDVIGVRPTIVTHPQSITVAGGTVKFQVVAQGAPEMTYQWYFNGTSIPGAIGPELVLNSVQAAQAGSYYVAISNPYGSATSSSATLTFALPQPTFSPAQSKIAADGSFQMRVEGSTTGTYSIEATEDFKSWTTVYTGTAPQGYIQFSEPNAKANAKRFYRVKLMP